MIAENLGWKLSGFEVVEFGPTVSFDIRRGLWPTRNETDQEAWTGDCETWRSITILGGSKSEVGAMGGIAMCITYSHQGKRIVCTSSRIVSVFERR